MDIIMQPVAIVKNERKEPEDDHWGNIISQIVLYDHIPQDALANISMFSRLQIIYYFNQLPGSQMNFARKPRGNPDYPTMGVFAQRNKDRPNSIGLCTVELFNTKEENLW